MVRITGEGVRIKPKPKSHSGFRNIFLPVWAVKMLSRRQAESEPNDGASCPLHDGPSARPEQHSGRPSGGVRPGRISRHHIPHVPGTVATLMDLAGLTSRVDADQLGHAKVSMTTDHSFGRRVAVTEAAAVLEAVDTRAKKERKKSKPQNESHG